LVTVNSKCGRGALMLKFLVGYSEIR
jgi:hypothetical protein